MGAQGLSLQDVRRHDVTEPPLYSHATRVLLLRNGSWVQARHPRLTQQGHRWP